MPLLDLQRRMRELGRIRTGEKVRSANGTRPAKLETFRLTSPSRPLIEAVAAVYGGTVKPWEGQWEVKTTTDTLPIVIPPGQSLTQWWEAWTGGGCIRRCDGETELLSGSTCLCVSEGRSPLTAGSSVKDQRLCKPTTRLSVILPAIPDIGVWRLESHGYYAAVELAAMAELLQYASAKGALIPARLRLEQREKKVPGKATLRYAVPVIEVGATVGELIDGLVGGDPDGTRRRLGDGGSRPDVAAVLAPAEVPGPDDRLPPGPVRGAVVDVQQRSAIAPIWEGVTEG